MSTKDNIYIAVVLPERRGTMPSQSVLNKHKFVTFHLSHRIKTLRAGTSRPAWQTLLTPQRLNAVGRVGSEATRLSAPLRLSNLIYAKSGFSKRLIVVRVRQKGYNFMNKNCFELLLFVYISSLTNSHGLMIILFGLHWFDFMFSK